MAVVQPNTLGYLGGGGFHELVQVDLGNVVAEAQVPAASVQPARRDRSDGRTRQTDAGWPGKQVHTYASGPLSSIVQYASTAGGAQARAAIHSKPWRTNWRMSE